MKRTSDCIDAIDDLIFELKLEGFDNETFLDME